VSQIEKSDLDELIHQVEDAKDSMQDVESQAAIWGEEAGALESLAGSAYSEVEDVLTEMRLIRKGLAEESP